MISYCKTEEKRPIMSPPAPQQTYIDCYPSEVEENSSRICDDCHDKKNCENCTGLIQSNIRQRENYEAEVRVYRALEKVNERFIVLHGFKFTHHQYRICDYRNHDRNACPNCKGAKPKSFEECDFLVVGPNYFVVIEVKNSKPGIKDDPVCSFEKSIKQRDRVKELIHALNDRVDVFLFTAFPSIQSNQFEAAETVKESIIFDAHLGDFSKWWDVNVTQKVTSRYKGEKGGANSDTDLERVKHILLAISCTEVDEPDNSRFSLAKTVRIIDKQLREGLITLEQKVGKPKDRMSCNPGVEKAPDVIAKYIGVKYLTPQQIEILSSDENLMWINGPAGSGKTVILSGKMILQATINKEKVVVFKITGSNVNYSTIYECTCKKAGLDYDLISLGGYKDYGTSGPSKIADDISLTEKRVVIVEIKRTINTLARFPEIIGKLADCNVIVDDIHGFVRLSKKLLQSLITISSSKTVWIGCDTAQRSRFNKTRQRNFTITKFNSFILENVPVKQRVTLSKNLRNTHDLSTCLSIVRTEYIKLVSDGSDNVKICLPEQYPGHFIHGPIISVHIFKDYSIELIDNIFTNELYKLHDDFEDTNVSIVFDRISETTKDILKDVISKGRKETTVLCHCFSSFSAEWPAIVAVMGVDVAGKKEYDLMRLYLMASRARVRCSILIVPEEGLLLDEYPFILDLFKKLEPHSHVMYHSKDLAAK